MTATAETLPRQQLTVVESLPASGPIATTVSAGPVRPAPMAASSLLILAGLLLGFAGYVTGVGAVTHARTQRLAYAELRQQLADGTAPVSQLSLSGAPLPLGAPVALLEAPGLREVVREGTTAEVLAGGPGHRRDTVLPGQQGTSVLYGRRAAFGGPLRALPRWHPGVLLTVTTGQGRQAFTVVGVRRAGSPIPPPVAGSARLTVVTADGAPFAPRGLVLVDAVATGPAQPTAPPRPVALLPAERPLATDRGALVPLLLWAQALLVAACLVAGATRRWGARQAWLVGVPLLALLATATAAAASSAVLPNLA